MTLLEKLTGLLPSTEWVVKSVNITRCPDKAGWLVSGSCNFHCDSRLSPFGRLREQFPKHKYFAYLEKCRCFGVISPDYQEGWLWWWWWHFCHEPLMVLQEVNTSKDLDSSLYVINYYWLSCTVQDQRVALLQFSVILVHHYWRKSYETSFFLHLNIWLTASVSPLTKESSPKVKPQGNLQFAAAKVEILLGNNFLIIYIAQ